MAGDMYDNDDLLQAEWDWFDEYQKRLAGLTVK